MKMKESGVGNKEPMHDVLAEKGMHFVLDPKVIEEKLIEFQKRGFIGVTKALIMMTDVEEGEESWWAANTANPSMKDVIIRIK